MSDSVLLKLARDSILEVYQAKRLIDKQQLLQSYPILASAMNCTLKTYLKNELRSSYTSQNTDPLLENIIITAKKAVFEDPKTTPLTTNEYLHVELELILHTPDGDISEKSPPILKENKDPITMIDNTLD